MTGKDMHGHPQPFSLALPEVQAGPLVFASPHSGRFYPPELLARTRRTLAELRRCEDAFMDHLVADMPGAGYPVLAANYARAWLDLNRERGELDPAMFEDPLPPTANTRSERVAAGYGLIPRIAGQGLDIYDGPLLYRAERARIRQIYEPYHTALDRLMRRTRRRFGRALLVDCHSMPSAARLKKSRFFPGRARQRPMSDPDIVLGDRFGLSCHGEITARAEAVFADMGYTVARNIPYSGGYCTVRHGRPEAASHALQVEVNRKLYLDEGRLELRADGLRRLQAAFRGLAAALSNPAWDISAREAAE